jgi:outer membrane protein assembly factor BamB
VYFGSFDHFVYALDRATGALAWKFDAQSVVTHGPMLADGRVVVGVRDASNLYALDAATGRPAWTRFFWLSWVDSTPCLADGVLYVGSSDSQRLRALDPRTGRTRWERWVGGWAWGTPRVVDDTVYYGTAGGDGYFVPVHASLGALDRATGAIRWRVPFANDAAHWPGGHAASLAYGDGRIVAADLAGGLTAYRTGR